ncbi:hypothetical protein ACFFRR_010443 [Megaselia abdita]
MKFAVVFMAIMALTAAHYIKPSGDVKYFDKDMVYKQKFFLDILFKVWEPLYFKEYVTMGEQFYFDKTYYTEYDHDMEYFYEMYKTMGFSPRGLTYSVFNKHFLKEVTGLFKFFYYAKDFETFQKNVCWARQYMNEGVFVYALEMFVMHNEHYNYIVFPSLHEVLPFFFYNGKFITTVKEFNLDLVKHEEIFEKKYFDFYEKLHFKNYFVKHFDWYTKKFHYVQDFTIFRDEHQMATEVEYKKFFEGVKMYWIKADYTDYYGIYNQEAKLNYLSEDFDWNMYWYYFNMQYPFFMEGKQFKLDARRGEYFLYSIQQILARYYAERYSHGLGEIKEFSFYTPVEYGYNPYMINYAGYQYSYRPNYYEIFNNKEYNAMNIHEAFEHRIRHVIDLGYYEKADGTKFYFNKPESVEKLGLILQGSVDSIDRKFFGSLMTVYTTLLGFGEEYDLISEDKHFSYMPNVLFNFETMMRDPVFYQIFTRVYDIVYYYKFRLGHYAKTELEFPGVKINDVHYDKLVTYFDMVDSDVSSLLFKDYFFVDGKFNWNFAVFGRKIRLNNKPFSITYDFESDKAQKVVFRTFIGPKYDEFGKELVFDYSRRFFYEIDQFYYDAVVGKNTYKRESHDFFFTKKDHTTYFELYKYVLAAFDGKYEFPVNYDMNKQCGFPERLLFPRGWTNGLPMKMYVIATPYDASVKEYTYEQHDMYCGMDYDKLPYGYPLDRPIVDQYFWADNMYYKDIFIYHLKDLHNYSQEFEHYFPKFNYYY